MYQYKDHLGNIRLSYKNDDSITPISSTYDFNTSTAGWSQSNTTTLSNADEQLNINVVNRFHGTSNFLSITPESKLHLEFDFHKGDMNITYLIIAERINGVWESNSNRDVIYLPTGFYEGTFDFTGEMIKITFEKGSSTDNGISTTCYVDNFKATQNGIEIVEENNYYPFGLKHKGYNNVTSANVNSVASKFKYNGVEFEESLGLDLYEMDMRQYDPAIARWTSIYPVTHFSMSTYTAFDNNPVYWSDPSGADSEDCCGDPPDRKGERDEVYFDEDGMAWTWDEKLNEWIDHSNLDEIIVSKSNTENSGNSGMASIYSSLDSEADRSWFDDHPEHEEPIRAAANRAGLAEFFRAGSFFSDDGYGDALRHAYWSYLITKELGSKVAKAFTDNHEDISGSNNLNEPRGLMDLNNNAWGINLATSGKPVNMVNSFTEYFNRAVISGDIKIENEATIPANLDERIESTQRASEWALKYGERE